MGVFALAIAVDSEMKKIFDDCETQKDFCLCAGVFRKATICRGVLWQYCFRGMYNGQFSDESASLPIIVK